MWTGVWSLRRASVRHRERDVSKLTHEEDSRSAQCIAYLDKEFVCANGFFQIAACAGEVKCFTCGKPSDRVPHCLKNELP